MQYFAANIIETQVFSKVALVRAYNQLSINADEIAKTAIVMPFRLFEYVRIPFALNIVAQTLQHFMDNVFRDMQFVCVYLDGIMVAS